MLETIFPCLFKVDCVYIINILSSLCRRWKSQNSWVFSTNTPCMCWQHLFLQPLVMTSQAKVSLHFYCKGLDNNISVCKKVLDLFVAKERFILYRLYVWSLCVTKPFQSSKESWKLLSLNYYKYSIFSLSFVIGGNKI